MHMRSEHPMLKQCSSIHAQNFPEQCSTNATNELTKNFWLLEHLSHVGNARRGVAGFGADVGPVNASRDHQEQAHA
jgi:hypothetical protein